MANIRIIAGTIALAAALTAAPAPLHAKSCAQRDMAEDCGRLAPSAPLGLLDFMTQKPTAGPVRHAPKNSAAKSLPLPAAAPARVEISAGSADDFASPSVASAVSSTAVETDGVAVTSADDWNEIDAQADMVKIVNADELNEIDLAADVPSPAPPQEPHALKSMASAHESATDLSWIGKLLAAFAGTVAVASAVRLLVA